MTIYRRSFCHEECSCFVCLSSFYDPGGRTNIFSYKLASPNLNHLSDFQYFIIFHNIYIQSGCRCLCGSRISRENHMSAEIILRHPDFLQDAPCYFSNTLFLILSLAFLSAFDCLIQASFSHSYFDLSPFSLND